jgi:hypothetical protein
MTALDERGAHGGGAAVNAQQVTTTECRKVGEAFTQTLLKTSERDFSNTTVLGGRLLEELRKRGLAVAAIEPSLSSQEEVQP